MDDPAVTPAGPAAPAAQADTKRDWSDVMAGGGAEARAILRAVTRMSPLPVVLCDPAKPDCPVVFCNEAFQALTLYPEAEILGRNCRFLQGPDTDPHSIVQLRDAIAARRELQIDLWNYRKNGTKFWNSMFVGPVHDPDGKLIYFFGSQIDSTHRFQADSERAAEQRLDTLRTMARAVAREVDGLMATIVASTDRIARNAPADWVAEQLTRVAKAARATIRLSSQLLTFAGHQTLHPQILDLNRLLAEFRPIAAKIAGSRLRVEVALHSQTLPARLDPGQLNLTLFSLVQNAVEAARNGTGTIRLTALSRTATEVEIVVADDGTGMDEDTAARACIPFFTTKTDRGNAGLGLSTAAGFCQQSDGRLLIETAAGKGATIRLVFPRAAP